jgi:TatD DNase family protein
MMKVNYIDAHCHVQFENYDEDREALLNRMEAEGITAIVVGCRMRSSEEAVALAEAHEHVYASIGHHPNESGETYEYAHYRELAKHPKVVAIGECGLDYFRPAEVTEEVKRAQKALFAAQIELAGELDKPLVIHSRPSKGTQDAYEDVIALLAEAKRKYPKLRGDIHFFVGGTKEADALIALGFTLSFTAVVTFARDYDAVLRHIPLTSILSETDAPYVAPASRRGQRNDPLSVKDVVAIIAQVRGEDEETVRKALVANAERLFFS